MYISDCAKFSKGSQCLRLHRSLLSCFMAAASKSLHARFANNAAILTIQKECVLICIVKYLFEDSAELYTCKLGEQVFNILLLLFSVIARPLALNFWTPCTKYLGTEWDMLLVGCHTKPKPNPYTDWIFNMFLWYSFLIIYIKED